MSLYLRYTDHAAADPAPRQLDEGTVAELLLRFRGDGGLTVGGTAKALTANHELHDKGRVVLVKSNRRRQTRGLEIVKGELL